MDCRQIARPRRCASQAGVAPPFSKGAEAGFLGQVLKKGALGGATQGGFFSGGRTDLFIHVTVLCTVTAVVRV